MATVTGMTSEKILELVSSAFVGASIDPATGVLTLQTQGGQTVTAGNVDNPDAQDAAVAAAIAKAYPIGAIYMSTAATNPASLFGMGTWVRWGKGRVPVSLDEAQTEFDAVEEVGGEKTHTLTSAEMPGHAHTINHDHGAFNTGSDGAHKHSAISATSNDTGINNSVKADGAGAGSSGYADYDPDGGHSHTVDVPNFAGNSGSAGGGNAHNNLQPYITCYMWKRTA